MYASSLQACIQPEAQKGVMTFTQGRHSLPALLPQQRSHTQNKQTNKQQAAHPPADCPQEIPAVHPATLRTWAPPRGCCCGASTACLGSARPSAADPAAKRVQKATQAHALERRCSIVQPVHAHKVHMCFRAVHNGWWETGADRVIGGGPFCKSRCFCVCVCDVIVVKFRSSCHAHATWKWWC